MCFIFTLFKIQRQPKLGKINLVVGHYHFWLVLVAFIQVNKFSARILIIEDTLRENTRSNKTEPLTKIMNIYIQTIGPLKQRFITGFYTQIGFAIKLISQ